MDKHTATEEAYKNGYEAGYKAGFEEAKKMAKIFVHGTEDPDIEDEHGALEK